MAIFESMVKSLQELTLGDLRRAVAGFYQDIAALGTQCCGNGFREGINTDQQRSTGFYTKLQLLLFSISIMINKLGGKVEPQQTLCANRSCCEELPSLYLAAVDRAEARAREDKARCISGN